MQFVLLCDTQRIARSIDGVTASVVLLEKQQDVVYGEEHEGGRSKVLLFRRLKLEVYV